MGEEKNGTCGWIQTFSKGACILGELVMGQTDSCLRLAKQERRLLSALSRLKGPRSIKQRGRDS